jgi:hypothetical protein
MSHSPAGSLKYCPTRKMLPGKCAPHHAVRLRSLGLDAVPRNTGFQSSCHDFSSQFGFTQRVQPTHKTSPFRDSHIAVKNA